MNSPSSPNPAAAEQASLWAARLEGGNLNASDRAALEAWLAEDAGHRALLSSYCQFSADLEVSLPALVEAGAIALPMPGKPADTPARFPRLVATIAALAAVLVFGFWAFKPATRLENFTAPPGQRQSFTLADGTRVELDAHTNLQFTERDGTRHARLEEGEAFFVVSKDKSRPFIVQTSSGSVRVTGTTFDVRAETAALDVTVIEGSVQVQPGAATGARAATSIALAAGDRLSATAGVGVTVARLSPEALEDALAWRQGIVVFAAEPLDAALARFARYHGRPIQVSPAAAKLPVSGRYSLDDLAGFLTAIEESPGSPTGLRAVKDPGGILRVGLRTE